MIHFILLNNDIGIPTIVGRHYVPMYIGKGRVINMYFVYILQSEKNGRYYIGSTNNLERRILEHNSGKTKSLKYLRPLKIVFKKDFKEEYEARQIENKLKKLKNRNIIERIIVEQELKMGS